LQILARFVIDGGPPREGELEENARSRATLVYGGKHERSTDGRGLTKIPSKNPFFTAFHTELDRQTRHDTLLGGENQARAALRDPHSVDRGNGAPKKRVGARGTQRPAIDGENYFVIRHNFARRNAYNIERDRIDVFIQSIEWQAACFEGARPKDCAIVAKKITQRLLPFIMDPSKFKKVEEVSLL